MKNQADSDQSANADVTGEFQVPPDMFTEDLPKEILQDRRALRRLRKADLAAKRAYSFVDDIIMSLRELRQKLSGKKLRKHFSP